MNQDRIGFIWDGSRPDPGVKLEKAGRRIEFEQTRLIIAFYVNRFSAYQPLDFEDSFKSKVQQVTACHMKGQCRIKVFAKLRNQRYKGIGIINCSVSGSYWENLLIFFFRVLLRDIWVKGAYKSGENILANILSCIVEKINDICLNIISHLSFVQPQNIF